MPDPYPDADRTGPAVRAGAAPPRRRRPAFGLLLATLLMLVVVLAAMRGRNDAPVLVSSPATGQSSPVGSGDPVDDAISAGEEAAAGTQERPGGDAEVLGTTTTPTAAPEPTPTVRVEDLPTSGSGEFVSAPSASAAHGAEPHRRFAVAVETGLDVDVRDLAAFVDTVLGDDRSWIGDGVTGFWRVAGDDAPDFTIVVATPDTVDRLCAPLQTAGRYSCAANGWVALNLHRWMTATPDWPASLDAYRHYLLNHEIGHYILGPDHDSCPEPGALAPIMMQQTIDLAGCRPNGWVYPRRS